MSIVRASTEFSFRSLFLEGFPMKKYLVSGLLVASSIFAFSASSMADGPAEVYKLTDYELNQLKGIARRDEAVGSMISFSGTTKHLKEFQEFYDLSNSTVQKIAKKVGGVWPGRIVPVSTANVYMAWFGWQIKAWHKANKGILKLADNETCKDLKGLQYQASSDNTPNEQLWEKMQSALGCQ